KDESALQNATQAESVEDETTVPPAPVEVTPPIAQANVSVEPTNPEANVEVEPTIPQGSVEFEKDFLDMTPEELATWDPTKPRLVRLNLVFKAADYAVL